MEELEFIVGCLYLVSLIWCTIWSAKKVVDFWEGYTFSPWDWASWASIAGLVLYLFLAITGSALVGLIYDDPPRPEKPSHVCRCEVDDS